MIFNLCSGALANGRVRCPWHGACFNIRTGDIEDFPGLDSVQKFDVSSLPKNVLLSFTFSNQLSIEELLSSDGIAPKPIGHYFGIRYFVMAL